MMISGSANLTDKSVADDEFCFQMTGPVARQLLEKLAQQRVKHPLWNGL